MKNFRQILSDINVEPLLAQLRGNPQLWNIDDSWSRDKQGSAIYDVDTIVLRFNRSSFPGLNDWSKPAFEILSGAQEIIFDLMRAIPGEHLGKVLITRLPAGETIAPHIDQMPPGIPPYYQRYQIPLSVLPDVKFICGDEEVQMKPGEAWWFDNQVTHSVVNHSSDERISMLTDIRPFTV